MNNKMLLEMSIDRQGAVAITANGTTVELISGVGALVSGLIHQMKIPNRLGVKLVCAAIEKGMELLENEE